MGNRQYILESDANKMFCPIINGNCKGAECMMWVWSNCDPEVEKRKKDAKSTINKVSFIKVKPIKGWCGK